jgi:hypothetical protein
MNIDRTIAEIKYLERIFAVPDTRPPSLSDLAACESQAEEALKIRRVSGNQEKERRNHALKHPFLGSAFADFGTS